MLIISHRGNINGIVSEKENRPSYIDTAIGLGYDVEVDIRYIGNTFWLGHDEPQYKVEESWMQQRKSKVWYHCKDLESAKHMIKLKVFNFFCHTQDSFVLTSMGHMWVHDLTQTIDELCIIPLLSVSSINNYSNTLPFAVCTDYVNICSKKFIIQ